MLYRRLLGYTRPYLKPLIGATLAMGLAGAIEGAFIKYLQIFLDWLFTEGRRDQATLILAPLGIVAIFVLSGVFGFLGSYGAQWVGNKVILDLRRAMFERFLLVPTHYYDTHTSGTLISKVANDVLGLQAAATTVLTSLVKDGAMLIVLLFTLFSLNWRLTLITFIIVPILAWVIRQFSLRLRRISRDAQTANAGVLDVLGEALTNHRVVRIFGGDAHERKRFGVAANRIRQVNMKHSAAVAAMTPINQLLVAMAIGLIVYLAISGSGLQTVGEFTGFVVAIAALLGPLKKITSINEHLQRGLAAAESVFAVIDAQAEPDTGTQRLQRARGDITFTAVSLRYGAGAETRLALDHINLTITAGETLALVGASGGGKSSLVHLLPRFYEPTSGVVALDGLDLRTIRLADLRAQMALVSQDVRLFNDTVAANIAYGADLPPDAASIRAAAIAAHAHSFIEQLPEGYATVIGENGGRLSGGQRQRIAIARAFLKDAPILLLDEATSALDSESERHVQAALEDLMRGRTTLIIAHRLSTIEKADRIVVLGEGRILEIGSHAELLARDGAYAALHRLQFGTPS
jgi:ATP-binding cassette, subfamily B, bacterial MsbA